MLTTRLIKQWSWWLVGLICLVVLGWIVWSNFPRGVFLTGWDALHPEFNLTANWQRALTAGWQEQYGVGVLGGHGFGALLPHVVIIWMLSWLPLLAIRPVFIFGCFILGGVGILVFLRSLLLPLAKRWRLESYAPWVAGIGGLYYLLNLGTVQQFYNPLEAFIVQYFLWPWCWWVIILILEKLNWKRVGVLGLICLIGSVQGFIPSLFVAFMLGLVVFLSIWWWSERFIKSGLVKISVILGTVLLVNAYWLLPFGYYVVSNQGDFLTAYNNLVSTPEFVNKSLSYGDFKSVAFLKSFLLEGEQPSGKVFKPWLEHLDSGLVNFLGWILVGLIVLGLSYTIFRSKDAKIRALGVMTLVLFAMLAHAVFPFSLFWSLVQSWWPLFEQAFRTSFTKFGLGLAFGFTVFLSLGVLVGLRVIRKYFDSNFSRIGWVGLVFAAVIVWGWPVLTGNLLNRQLKVEVPQAYFELMELFNRQEEGRIAELPIECSEGWYTRPWGYYGSGFWWYGIKQPVLARTFDVWSRYNENFYWEALYALRQPDYSGLDDVLNKYQVKWVVFDPNLIHCSNENGLAYQQDLASYFEQHEGFQRIQKITDAQLAEPLTIYQVTESMNEQFIEAPETYAVVNSGVSGLEYDRAFKDVGDFVEGKTDAVYVNPWRGLFTQNLKRQGVEINENDQEISLTSMLGTAGETVLTIPAYGQLERVMPIEVSLVASGSGYMGTINYLGPRIENNEVVLWDGRRSESFGPVQIENLETLKLSMDNEPITRVTEGYYVGAVFMNFNNSLMAIENNGAKVWWQSGASETYRELMLKQQIPISAKGSEWRVVLPKVNDEKRFGQVIEASDFSLPQDCSVVGIDGMTRYELAKGGDSFTRLISEGDELCLRVSIPEARPADGYVVTFAGKHVAGMMPRYNIYNWRGIRYQFGYVPETVGDFGVRLIVPPVFKTDQSYMFEVGNVSYGQTETINDVQRIEYWFIPYWFIQNLKIGTKINSEPGGFGEMMAEGQATSDKRQATSQIQNILQIQEVRKYGTSHYRVAVSHKPQVTNDKQTGLIALSQGYDAGWMAYELKTQNSKLKTFVPWFFGDRLEHLKLNGWGNGWLLNRSQMTDDGSQIVIIYWPQYLEWVGLLLIPLSIIVIVRLGRRKKVE